MQSFFKVHEEIYFICHSKKYFALHVVYINSKTLLHPLIMCTNYNLCVYIYDLYMSIGL